MDEARRVIDRLERIDSLRSSGAEPRAILVELRALVREGQGWLGVEGEGEGTARAALGSLESALERRSGGAGRPSPPEGVALTDAAF